MYNIDKVNILTKIWQKSYISLLVPKYIANTVHPTSAGHSPFMLVNISERMFYSLKYLIKYSREATALVSSSGCSYKRDITTIIINYYNTPKCT